MTNEEVYSRSQVAIGAHNVQKRIFRWYGHISRSSGVVMQGTEEEQGGAERKTEEEVGRRLQINEQEWGLEIP